MRKVALSTEIIRWIESRLRIPEGKNVGKPFKLAQFMKDDFKAIYDNPAGTRLAIISRGRKNAKTTQCALIVLVHLVGPMAKQNTGLYSAAQSKDQAARTFDLASKMVRMAPSLQPFVRIRDHYKQIYVPEIGTIYSALSAEAKTAFGLAPSLIIHDELGQVKGPKSKLYDALETATGAGEDPLSVIISTQAPTDADLLSLLIDDAQTNRDKTTVLRFQAADPALDPFSLDAIKQANPAFDIFMNKKEVLKMRDNARNMPARQSEFENLVLNRRVEVNNPFVSDVVWKKNSSEVVSTFDGLPVYGGLDLSATSDLTALVLIAPKDGKWHVKPTFWLPGQNIVDKSREDCVPYDVWAQQGFLQTTPGMSVDYEFVAEYLRGLFDFMDIRQINFDDWNWKHFKPWLKKAGFGDDQLDGDSAVFKPMRQGFQTISPALRDLETELLNGRIAHGNHPVMHMCARNAVVESDPAGNRKLSKAKSRGRIDGLQALTMAKSAAGTHELTEEPEYQIFVF